MSEPYLIAHKVRGEPAFDIAERMVCPECGGEGKDISESIALALGMEPTTENGEIPLSRRQAAMQQRYNRDLNQKRNDRKWDGLGCPECDHLGYWWIISTSGHRAYPWWNARLIDIDDQYELSFNETTLDGPGTMPLSIQDHYRSRAEEKRTIDVSALTKPKPFKMNRRI